ncbi:FeoB-associated Cys-rich membrane protein [Intestinibacter sp.]|uniref:FeoB-associated Cys-rich membrane protein n=1 Tax=Intestinibacter sp. TaxID=1965304 RepID=UPI002A74AD4E|nr:FeoB-associated Cys-rich membrane protein [Intestinibacter sp.]MDY2735734.1 FeoB-associated Cys-rich membrane protein [Intestinibacter sp.]
MINYIIAIVAISIVVATIGNFVKKSKSGKGGCGCGCNSCSSASSCHSNIDFIVDDLKKIK